MDEDLGGSDADFLAAVQTAESSRIPRPPPASSSSAPRPASTNPTVKAPAKVTQPTPQALPQRAPPSSILVSPRQKGNPILASIHSIPWEYSDIPADYLLSPTTALLFLSLKYHRLHPEYIYNRIRSLGHKYNLRLLLTMVDIPNHEDPLKELSKTSLINNLTLILCWSAAEAGRYLELYKSFEHAGAGAIKGKGKEGWSERVVEFITVPRSVNKTDAVGLMSQFGSLSRAIQAGPEEVGLVAGWGEKKVERWCAAVREPFRVRKAAKRGGQVLKRTETQAEEETRLDRAEEDTADLEATAVDVPRVSAERRPEQSVAERVETEEQESLFVHNDDSEPEDADMVVPNEDEEMLALAAAVDHDTLASSGRIREGKEANGLSEGVMSALARLRDQG